MMTASDVNTTKTTWGYIRVRPSQAEKFVAETEALRLRSGDEGFWVPECFVHKSVIYTISKRDVAPTKEFTITPIGLVFLRGTTDELKEYLNEHFPEMHLVNDAATGRAAEIPDEQMEPLRLAVEKAPEEIKYLDDPIARFASYAKIRMLSGTFKGRVGYLVRVRRDRKLVFGVAGMTVAIGGIHKEKFEVIEQ